MTSTNVPEVNTMKICPRCQKTYTDDNLNFCLEDGSVLEQSAGGPLPETVLLNQPRITVPVQPTQGQQIPGQYAPQQGWNTGPQAYSNQPRKSSKTWIWVVLILGGLAVVCGGGLVGLILYGASQADKETNKVTNIKPSPAPNSNTGNSKSSSTPSTARDSVTKIDLQKWVQTDQSYGVTEFSGGELVMSSRKSGYYYVLAGTKDQVSVGADVKVTVRNIDNDDTKLGYGLVFHSNPKPLQKGYAFLIRSNDQKYRIVRHSPEKEDEVLGWTNSDAIKTGSDPNTIEVRDLSDKIEFYINDKLVNSIRNTYGYPNGVLGLYAGDGIKVGFSNLEIHK